MEIEGYEVMAKLRGVKITCSDCNHCVVFGGSPGTWNDPPEPDEFECQESKVSEDLGDEYDWDHDVMPGVCGHFYPIMVGNCACCGKVINVPRFAWELWSYEYDYGESVSVCSQECKDIMDKVLHEKREEERLMIEEYEHERLMNELIENEEY